MDHLVGPHEVAQMLGVSRQRVTQLADRGDFPEPVAVLKACKVWTAADIRAWAKADGRSISED